MLIGLFSCFITDAKRKGPKELYVSKEVQCIASYFDVKPIYTNVKQINIYIYLFACLSVY